MAGPWIGRIMACCGADVIKVESREHPDVTRLYVPPRQPELGVQSQRSPWFTDWNAGKRFVALDLTRPEATKLARRLIAESDIVIDNNANGVMEKLGLGFDQLQCDNPELILLSSTGYGKSGPDSSYISWGPNIETLSGLSCLSGFAHRDCTMTQFAYPDPLSALYGLFAILCALEHRRKTGRGQQIKLSQLEATVASIGSLVMEVFANDREPAKLGNGCLGCAPQGCYPCRGEDRWCVISVSSQQQWQHLCDVLQRPNWLADDRFALQAARLAHRQTLDTLIAEASGGWQADELMQALQGAGVPAGVVQNVEDQYRRDPHLAQRRYFETITHQLMGEVVAPGIPLGLGATPGKTTDTGRPMGSDNHAVFCGLLGLAEADYEALLAVGVIEA
jgi:benzylsuccinate CoA-transferase BbsF subunit